MLTSSASHPAPILPVAEKSVSEFAFADVSSEVAGAVASTSESPNSLPLPVAGVAAQETPKEITSTQTGEANLQSSAPAQREPVTIPKSKYGAPERSISISAIQAKTPESESRRLTPSVSLPPKTRASQTELPGSGTESRKLDMPATPMKCEATATEHIASVLLEEPVKPISAEQISVKEESSSSTVQIKNLDVVPSGLSSGVEEVVPLIESRTHPKSELKEGWSSEQGQVVKDSSDFTDNWELVSKERSRSNSPELVVVTTPGTTVSGILNMLTHSVFPDM